MTHDPPNASRRRPIIPAAIAALGVVMFGGAVLGMSLLGGRSNDAGGEQRKDDRGVVAVATTEFDVARSCETTTTTRVEIDSPSARDMTKGVAGIVLSDRDRDVAASSSSGGRLDGESMIAMLPPSLIELARQAVWDERTTEALDRFMLLAFDANTDGVLDDFERIVAVRALRDAMWPTFVDETEGLHAAAIAPAAGAPPIDSVLSAEDLRIFHDVDESRRLDHASQVDGAFPSSDRIDTELRERVVERFRLDDDGRLSATEFARFLRHYHVQSDHADLNQDGRVDEADLRLFLDIATPIGTR